jgi:hypothetical protein
MKAARLHPDLAVVNRARFGGDFAAREREFRRVAARQERKACAARWSRMRGWSHPHRQCMECSMRNLISSSALAVALAAGANAAQAQTVDTVIAPQPGPVAIAPAVPPVETVQTVRTVQSTTAPRRHVARRDRVTTTRTTVTERIVPAPMPITPAVAAITQPTYTEVVQTPYPRLYDVVTPALAAAPPAVMPAAPVAATTPVPTYRYVYEPDRILVIDPYTNIAVQAIPR